jgi:hypothetical protein
MSTHQPLSISAILPVCYLCQHEPNLLLGGSLGLELNRNPPDPYVHIHDVDLIFTSRYAAEEYITRKILSVTFSSAEYKGEEPYAHWKCEFCGIPVCILLNPEAKCAHRWMAIRLQDPDQIRATREVIYKKKGKSK